MDNVENKKQARKVLINLLNNIALATPHSPEVEALQIAIGELEISICNQ